MIDQDDTAMSNTQSSNYARIFSPDHYVCGWNRGATGSFASGCHHSDGLVSKTMEKVRKLYEGCDNLETFQFFHSTSGGTGSGLTSTIQAAVNEEYPEIICANHTIFPYETFQAGTLEIYNTVFAMQGLLENCDLCFTYNNESLLAQCQSQPTYSIMNPNFSELNSIIAQQATNLTASFRFPGTLNSTFRKMAMNLIPHPRMHFLSIAHSNLRKKSADRQDFLNMTTTEVIKALFDDQNSLVGSAGHGGMV
jgi:tubulin beta